MSYSPFTAKVIELIRAIPEGKVTTYGDIARAADSPRAARQVVRILHTCSKKENLPWHRVVNREGKIALKPSEGYETQRALLEAEGIRFGLSERISFESYYWDPAGAQLPINSPKDNP